MIRGIGAPLLIGIRVFSGSGATGASWEKAPRANTAEKKKINKKRLFTALAIPSIPLVYKTISWCFQHFVYVQYCPISGKVFLLRSNIINSLPFSHMI
jgi:hypothetical protein